MVEQNTVAKGNRTIIYARYSTDDQNELSIEDQFKACERWLDRTGFKCASVVKESDEGISGEVLSRPGINRVREMIRARKADLVIAEEISRFYRDRAEPFKLAGECHDHDVRLVAINDGIDTDTEGWERNLSRASDEHASANDKTSLRIKRAYHGRWQDGYAMGAVVPGYKRTPVDSERFGRTRRGPFKDQKDESWTTTIQEMFGRVARGDSLRSVADFLSRQGLPRPANSKASTWNDRGVKTLVQNPLFKGKESYRKKFNKKHYATGRHVPEHSRPEEVMFRDMPHLAHVDAMLWQQANDAIARRDLAGRHPKGPDNPSYRVPRESRSPLSNHFFCGVCGSKMIGQGRNEGGYRCSNALRGECWNRATVKRDLTHTAIFRAVGEALLGLKGVEGFLVEQVELVLAESGDVARRVTELEEQNRVAEDRIGKCGEALLASPGSEYLAGQLAEAEARRAELLGLVEAMKSQVRTRKNPPSRQQILDTIDHAVKTLADSGPDVGPLLRQLTTPIQAIPFQRIDCDLVVLRVRFHINLVALLPTEWQQLLRGADVTPHCEGASCTEATIDLFENPGPVRFAKEALLLQREGHTGEEISNRLGISRRTTYDAIKLAELMEERGVNEPYVQLNEAPASASRWRHRRQECISVVR